MADHNESYDDTHGSPLVPSHLQNKVVRDLWWVLGGAHILGERADAQLVEDSWCQAVVARADGWLRALDAEPEPLLAFLREQRGRARLGHYVAALLEYWLCASPELRTDKLVSGAQLEAEGGEGLGQLKFLFRPRSTAPECEAEGVCWHWELHVKFFLFLPAAHADDASDDGASSPGGTADERLLERYVGPFVGETLLDRTRILTHRLAMGSAPALRRWLRERFFAEPSGPAPAAGAREARVESAGLLRGTLFYPLPHPPPARADPALSGLVGARHLRGWYCTDGIEAALAAFPGAMWALPMGEGSGKFHWLAPAHARARKAGGEADGAPRLQIAGESGLDISPVDVLTAEEVAPVAALALARYGGTPILLLEMRRVVKGEGEEEEWVERSRGFVLPLNWDPTPLWRRPPPGAPAQPDGAPARHLALSSRERAAKRYHGRAMAAVSHERFDATAAERVATVRLSGEPRERLPGAGGAAGARGDAGAEQPAPVTSDDLLRCLGVLPSLAPAQDAPAAACEPAGGSSASAVPGGRFQSRVAEARLLALVTSTDCPSELVLEALLQLGAMRTEGAGAHAEPGCTSRQLSRAAAHLLVDALLRARHARRAYPTYGRSRRIKELAAIGPPPDIGRLAYAGQVGSVDAAAELLLGRMLAGSSALCVRAVARTLSSVGLKLRPHSKQATTLRSLIEACARPRGAECTRDALAEAVHGIGALLLCELAVLCGVQLGADGRPGSCAPQLLVRLVGAILEDVSLGAEGADGARTARRLLAHERARADALAPAAAADGGAGAPAAAPSACGDARACALVLRMADGRCCELSAAAEHALALTARRSRVAAAGAPLPALASEPQLLPGAQLPAYALPPGCDATLVDSAGALRALTDALLECARSPGSVLALDVEWRPDGSSSALGADGGCERAPAAECPSPGADERRGAEYGRNPPALLQLAVGSRRAGAACVLRRVFLLDLLLVEQALGAGGGPTIDGCGSGALGALLGGEGTAANGHGSGASSEPALPGPNGTAPAALAAAALAAGLALRRALHSTRCLKLGFAFSEDLERLHFGSRRLRCFDLVAPLCDLRASAQAALRASAERGGNGLAALLARLCGLSLDKGEQTSDWAARPLSASQLAYAANDAACLLPLYDALCASAPLALGAATSHARPSRTSGCVRLRPAGATSAPSAAALARVRQAVGRAPPGTAWVSAANPAAAPAEGPSAPPAAAAEEPFVEANAICVVHAAPPAGESAGPPAPLPADAPAPPLLVVTAAGTKLDLSALADAAVSGSRLRLAHADECEWLFGANAGFVPPVPLRAGVRVLLHPSVACAARLCASAGEVGLRLWIDQPAHGSLQALTGGQWLELLPKAT